MLTSIFIFTLLQILHLNEGKPQLEIKQGVLQGSIKKTWLGKPIFAFQGIPYAQPPIGDKRFQAPEPLLAWEGVLDATKNHESCPQRELFFNNKTIFGDENCLFLNVYTPKIAKSQLLPVIVFIHGGGFMTDSGNPNLYGPDIMLDKDVVMVTINYRLGALGFLSFESEVLSGNNGLKDQSLALQWVKNNINNFGGNPDKITIFGNSAGGASVYYHVLSPLSKSLFHGAISSSGIATSPWALAQKGEAKRNAEKLAEFLNCPIPLTEATLKCLQNVDAHDIVKQSDKFMEFHYEPSIPHKPVIELNIPGAFLTEYPINIIKSGKFAQIPYMTGITADDGALKSAAFYNNYTLIEQLNKNFDDFAPMVFHYDHHNSKKEISKSVKKFYFQNRPIDSNTKAELTNAVTDSLFYFPQRHTIQLHSKYTHQPVYFYLFNYKGSISISKYFGDPEHDYGVVHCDDLTYLLSNDVFENYTPTEDDLKMNDIMATLFYNFAATGNPTPEVTPSIYSKWEPLNADNFKYYAIVSPNSIQTEEKLNEDRYNFWKNIGLTFKLDKFRDEL